MNRKIGMNMMFCLIAGAGFSAGSALADTTFEMNLMPNRWVNPGVAHGFNPQPEPPGDRSGLFENPGVSHGFNPQPEPPGDRSSLFDNPGVASGFNPQPEPPGDMPYNTPFAY